MKWAFNKYPGGMRKNARPKDTGYCPLCGGEVISKCGDIKIWHWAHKTGIECDSFKEPETKWHLEWKDNFPEEIQEVIIIKGYTKHIADIKNKEDLIIEFQNSPICSEDIINRENFYDNLIWILNGKTLGKNLIYFKRRYKWKWFPQSWYSSIKEIYIDEGGEFLYKLNSLGSVGEYNKVSKSAFIIHNGGNPFKNGKKRIN